MNYITKSENTESNDLGNIVIKNLFNKESFNKLSIAEVQIKGDQEFGTDKESDIFITLSKGKVSFL